MDLTPRVAKSVQVIGTYGDGGFTISQQAYKHPVLVMREATLVWDVKEPADISLASLEPLLQAEDPIEILLIGCGEKALAISPLLRAALKERGIVCDVMDTGAACRTYNILIQEARKAAAALIPIG